jgi:hypothetical protein
VIIKKHFGPLALNLGLQKSLLWAQQKHSCGIPHRVPFFVFAPEVLVFFNLKSFFFELKIIFWLLKIPIYQSFRKF